MSEESKVGHGASVLHGIGEAAVKQPKREVKIRLPFFKGPQTQVSVNANISVSALLSR